MSWSIEEHIGECRPFPAQVVVYKGETDECLAYVSGEVADRLKAENAKLRALCRDMYLVVELLDMDGARLQAHGRDADWRTLKERYDELGVDE